MKHVKRYSKPIQCYVKQLKHIKHYRKHVKRNCKPIQRYVKHIKHYRKYIKRFRKHILWNVTATRIDRAFVFPSSKGLSILVITGNPAGPEHFYRSLMTKGRISIVRELSAVPVESTQELIDKCNRLHSVAKQGLWYGLTLLKIRHKD